MALTWTLLFKVLIEVLVTNLPKIFAGLLAWFQHWGQNQLDSPDGIVKGDTPISADAPAEVKSAVAKLMEKFLTQLDGIPILKRFVQFIVRRFNDTMVDQLWDRLFELQVDGFTKSSSEFTKDQLVARDDASSEYPAEYSQQDDEFKTFMIDSLYVKDEDFEEVEE